MLFKEFAGVDALPICLATKDLDAIMDAVKALAPGLRRHQPGGHLRAALLRDRGAPQGRARHPGLPRRPARHRRRRARRADKRRQLTGRRMRTCGVLSSASARPASRSRRSCSRPASARWIGCDSRGAVHTEREDYQDGPMPPSKRWFAEDEPRAPRRRAGRRDRGHGPVRRPLRRARVPRGAGADGRDAMVFAMANPTPEVSPEEAAHYARVSPPAARTTRTRSTTSSASRASSAARSTSARPRSPRR